MFRILTANLISPLWMAEIYSGKEYLPNKITRNLSYAYDDQGRLIQILSMCDMMEPAAKRTIAR